MMFSFSEEQKMLAETASRFALDRAAATRPAGEPRDRRTATWQQMAELGWLGIGVPEEHGGMGGGPVEVALVMEAIGRGPIDAPFLSSIAIGAGTLSRFGSPAQKETLLPAIVAGRTRTAAAFGEAPARYDLFDVATTARAEPGGFVLEGCKATVLDADADRLIVLARIDGGRSDPVPLTAFIVPVAAPGVKVDTYPTYDGHQACDVALSGVRVTAQDVLGRSGEGRQVAQWAADRAMGALCAEAVGAMSGAFELTLGYLKSRRQFGRAIGSFQALQHRMADLFAAIEEARSLALAAAWSLQIEADARRITAAAKIHIGRTGRLVADECIQMHGAIGMTDEYVVGRYAKRLLAIDTMFGDADYHLGQFPLEADEPLSEGGTRWHDS
jgi:alkylation response protein AidB-like acyl-CoA dehydrogenase